MTPAQILGRLIELHQQSAEIIANILRCFQALHRDSEIKKEVRKEGHVVELLRTVGALLAGTHSSRQVGNKCNLSDVDRAMWINVVADVT